MNKLLDPSKIKAIAIDLDGTTLLPDTTLGERTKNTLHKIIAKGIKIIIATGRAAEAVEKFRRAMGAEGPMVLFNGAVVTEMPSGRVLSVRLIDNDILDFCADTAREMDIYFQIYLQAGISPDTGKEDPSIKYETLVMEKTGPEVEMYNRHTGIVPVVKDLKKVLAIPGLHCIKGMYIIDPSLQDTLRQKLTGHLGSRVSLTRSFPNFLEVLNSNVSKGEGLKIALKHLGIKPENVIAFGDEENDLSMFEAAGFSAAPTSAREKIRQAADFIYASNAEEGLAAYLEETFL